MSVELLIERLSKSGDGVAQHDGRAVFVAGVIPGERVRAVVRPEGKVLRGELLEVLHPSSARRAPPCALASRCGGCDWMHLAETAQLEHKVEIVTSALEHVGGIGRASYELLPAVASPKALGYRRRATLHPVGARLGFFGRATHERVEVSRCPALSPGLTDLPGALAAPLGPVLKDVEAVQVLEAGERVAIAVQLKGAARPRHAEVLEALVREGVVAGAVLSPAEGKGPDQTFGEPRLSEDGRWLRPDAFSQANVEVNRALVAGVVQLLALSGGERVLELYSGNGNFTFALADALPGGGQVVAVESSPLGVQQAQQAAARRGSAGVRFVQGDAARVTRGLIQEAARFDRLLLDPPRAGAPEVGEWASRLLVGRVVYVACDPVSLARDAAGLGERGFDPVALRLFDLFPQTHHVEAVMSFARR